MPRRRHLFSLALAACALVPATAAGQAGTGGATPSGGTAPESVSADSEGGARVGQEADRRRRPRRASRPVLTSFRVDGSRFYAFGAPMRVSFRIDGRARSVRVRLLVYEGSRRARTIDLGERRTGATHTVAVEGGLPEGRLQLRISGRDARGRGLRRGPRAASSHSVEFYGHRFPLVGSFSYGGEGSRFGAPRSGHVHQGQDLGAAEGTPVVAPRGGAITTVAYQAGGAGNYVVLDGAGERFDYVFMHLQTGSTRVRVGQTVRTSERLASVGNTGSSSGAHLHFEIWDGAWQRGGRPVDPLPYLQRWDGWS
jgi:murein DD-endopeptidase MepM/ murein hydrolase activator NlpD